MPSLAEQYRPREWSDVVGQDRAVGALRDLVREQDMAPNVGVPASSPAWGAARAVLAEHCPHPCERLYSWHAQGDVLCIGCCECGAVLLGAAE